MSPSVPCDIYCIFEYFTQTDGKNVMAWHWVIKPKPSLPATECRSCQSSLFFNNSLQQSLPWRFWGKKGISFGLAPPLTGSIPLHASGWMKRNLKQYAWLHNIFWLRRTFCTWPLILTETQTWSVSVDLHIAQTYNLFESYVKSWHSSKHI